MYPQDLSYGPAEEQLSSNSDCRVDAALSRVVRGSWVSREQGGGKEAARRKAFCRGLWELPRYEGEGA